MQRSLLSLLIGATLTVICQLPAAAAPQPMVLFKQKVQVKAESPGQLSGATWVRRDTTPAIQERYSSFHGDAKVTRQQPGKPPQTVSLDDAVNSLRWLEVTGRGTRSDLRVRAVKAGVEVDYQIEIRMTTLAFPDGDELTRYGRYLKRFEDQQQLLTKIEEIRHLCVQLGDAEAVDLQKLVWDVSEGPMRIGTTLEKELADWLDSLPKLVEDPNAVRFVAAVQVAQAETAALPAPQLLDRHFAFVLRQLQSDYLKGKDRDGLQLEVTGLHRQIMRLKSDSSLQRYAAARAALSEALRNFSKDDFALIATEYLDDCILTFADPGDAAESVAIAREVLDHLPASYPGLSSDQEVHTFLAEIKELHQALQKQREQGVDNPAFSKFNREWQELASKFIFFHPAQRAALREQLAALRQEAKLP